MILTLKKLLHLQLEIRFSSLIIFRDYNNIPFLDLHQRTTGKPMSESYLQKLKNKYPNIESLTHDRLQCSMQILEKFGINAMEACREPHVFIMNPITVDNHGEILRECGFINIAPKHLIRYHTLVRSRTIAQLKAQSLVRDDLNLEEILLQLFHEWPDDLKILQNFADTNTSILTVRLSVLKRYLKWKLSVSEEDFQKYIRNYLPLKHKPMSDIKESLNIAENEIKFDTAVIRRNGFIIACDPINTKLIIESVKSLAGLDIQEAIRIEPAILKNNYNALLQIRDLLEEYRITKDAQRRCLKVYCMCPKTVQQRLDELINLKEYKVLATNPRVLSMVVHKNKMMSRLNKIQTAKKHCFSLNHLVSSSKVFNNYISNFGEKVCGKDIAILIYTSLQSKQKDSSKKTNSSQIVEIKTIQAHLKKHKYWLHVALQVIDENINFLKKNFPDEIILNNCHLLLYPIADVEQYIQYLLKMRRREDNANEYRKFQLDTNLLSLKYSELTDDQILSLVLYEIEKKYHFSGDGIWTKCDVPKAEKHSSE